MSLVFTHFKLMSSTLIMEFNSELKCIFTFNIGRERIGVKLREGKYICYNHQIKSDCHNCVDRQEIKQILYCIDKRNKYDYVKLNFDGGGEGLPLSTFFKIYFHSQN